MQRIENIKEKLKELKELDKKFSIFGSSKHKYEFNQTLKEEEIRKIEIENNIVLSNDYKNILMYLGNGGAGCGYGLERLNTENVNPAYIGTDKLLRNWDDPKRIDLDMINLDELSGYIKLFDYGCGMELCLVVNGKENESLIFYDWDGRFEKIENKTVLDFYEDWLNKSLDTLKRIEQKLTCLSLQEVIDSEWLLKNFSVKHMIMSIINAESVEFLEKSYKKWRRQKNLPITGGLAQWRQ